MLENIFRSLWGLSEIVKEGYKLVGSDKPGFNDERIGTVMDQVRNIWSIEFIMIDFICDKGLLRMYGVFSIVRIGY